jgi:signal peptidase II
VVAVREVSADAGGETEDPGGEVGGVRRSPVGGLDRGVRSRRAVVVLALTGVLIVVLDQITKLLAVAHLTGREPVELIPGVLDLWLTRNPGAAFSLAGGATVALSLVALAVMIIILRTARRLRSTGWAVVLGGLVGGAVGNMVDRVFRAPGPLRGHVVDWIYLHHWPVFNVADSAIVGGGILAVVLSALGVGLDGRRSGDDAPPAGASEQAAGGRAGTDGAGGAEGSGGMGGSSSTRRAGDGSANRAVGTAPAVDREAGWR